MKKNRKQNHYKQLSELKGAAREQLKQIVVARLETVPSHLRLSVGKSEYGKEDIIEHVQKEDNVGQQIMIAQLKFIQDLAKGNIYKDDQNYIDYQA